MIEILIEVAPNEYRRHKCIFELTHIATGRVDKKGSKGKLFDKAIMALTKTHYGFPSRRPQPLPGLQCL